MIFVGETV